jgi:hypothetical protein
MHDDNHGTEHAIKYFALDDNAIYVSTAYDFHPHNELVGPARDAAIDQLLDNIDFARIARAVNRRGYAVDVDKPAPDILDDTLNRYRTAFIDALALHWAGHDAEPVVPAQFVAAVIDPEGAPRNGPKPARP